MTSKKFDVQKRFKDIYQFKSRQEKDHFDTMMFHAKIMFEIEQLLEQRGWNKSKLALEIGTSKSYVTQLFRGAKLLNLNLLTRIQNALNVEFAISCSEKQIIQSALIRSINTSSFEKIDYLKSDSGQNNMVA